VRWFGRWLRDEPSEIDAEPPIRVFVRRSTRPAPDLAEMRGDWRFEPGWPLERSRTALLRPDGEADDTVAVRGDVGVAAWISCAGKLPWGQPDDQRPDDAMSLTYDWEPLADEVELLGQPRLELELTSSAPVAFLSAKLCDVFPDGTSALVTRGVLNLAHRESSTQPSPLEPGSRVRIRLELEATSWVFERGHGLRLSLAGSDWPNVWPPPEAATLTVARGSVALSLPVVEGPSPILETPVFAPSTGRDLHAADEADEVPVTWRIERDLMGRETRAVTAYGYDYDAPFDARVTERYEGSVGVFTDDPGRAWARGTSRYEIRWPEATVVAEARLDLRSDANAYHVVVDVVAEEGGEGELGRVERRWERIVPRDHQ
jgi:hypothetical protein